MIIKKREAISLYDFLNLMEDGNVDLSIDDWKVLSENRQIIEVALKELDDARMKLVREHSSQPEDAELIKVDEDRRQVFGKKYLDLLEEEIDLDLKTINTDKLGDTMKSKVGIWEFLKFMVAK